MNLIARISAMETYCSRFQTHLNRQCYLDSETDLYSYVDGREGFDCFCQYCIASARGFVHTAWLSVLLRLLMPAINRTGIDIKIITAQR